MLLRKEEMSSYVNAAYYFYLIVCHCLGTTGPLLSRRYDDVSIRDMYGTLLIEPCPLPPAGVQAYLCA